MSLKDSIRNDVSVIFLNVEEFAETVVYFFKGGGSRPIAAVIDRNPPEIYDPAGNVVLAAYTITIDDDCVAGVLRSEIDTGGDEVDVVAENGSAPPTRVTVLQVVEGDFGGSIQLALK